MNDLSMLILLLASGMLLIGAEIFVPGAVLGTMGAFALLGAVVVAFSIGLKIGFYTAFGILLLATLTVVMWVKFFPRTLVGRKMTLSEDGSVFKAFRSRQSLVGKTGSAHSELRPAGFAMIDGQRVDVVADGGIIGRGEAVRVIRVEGNRVVVRKADA